MGGEHGFEDWAEAPRGRGVPEEWDLPAEELGIVDPMSAEEFADLCAGRIRYIEPPRFDPDLFEPLPGTEQSCRCSCGHTHEAPPPPAAALPVPPGSSDGAQGPGTGDPSAGGLPSPEAAMAQIRLERAAEVLDALEANEAAQARLDADRVVLLAALARAEGSSSEVPVDRLDAPAVAAAETAALLRIAQRTARGMVEEALALAHPAMAPVLAAMRAGRLTRRRAAVVLDAAIPVPAARLDEFAAAAAAIAAPQDPDRTPTPGALGRRLRRLAEDYAAEPLAARRAKAVADRRVDLEPVGDGMCQLTALLPLEAGAMIDTRLTAIARALQAPDEARTVNQLRADALADLLLGSAPGAGPDSAVRGGALGGARGGVLGGVRTELVVTVPAATLAGTSDTPGEILGYGPIDPEAARRLAAQTEFWTRLVVAPVTGAPLAIGRVRYAPTAAMRRFLRIRDMTCTFPGCDKPGAACEADHTHAWAHGGETGVGNLAILCREHHRQKTLGYWTVRQIGTEQQGPGQGPEQNTWVGPEQGTTHEPAQEHEPTREQEPAQNRAPAPPGTLEWTGPSGRKHITYPHSDPPPPF